MADETKPTTYADRQAEAFADRAKIEIHVIHGHVWEHDVDADGLPSSGLRPHYDNPKHPDFPKGGYPHPAAASAALREGKTTGPMFKLLDKLAAAKAAAAKK